MAEKKHNSTRGGSGPLASNSCDNKTNSCKSRVWLQPQHQQHSRLQKHGFFRPDPAAAGVLVGVVMMLAVKMAMMMAADMIM